MYACASVNVRERDCVCATCIHAPLSGCVCVFLFVCVFHVCLCYITDIHVQLQFYVRQKIRGLFSLCMCVSLCVCLFDACVRYITYMFMHSCNCMYRKRFVYCSHSVCVCMFVCVFISCVCALHHINVYAQL